jgi:hypothetical protein
VKPVFYPKNRSKCVIFKEIKASWTGSFIR